MVCSKEMLRLTLGGTKENHTKHPTFPGTLAQYGIEYLSNT